MIFICFYCIHFNPRSHERSDPWFFSHSQVHLYFNPRSHERSDVRRSCCRLFFRISIHAPTRGATLTVCGCGVDFRISIHAPTRGATLCLCRFCNLKLFQSTLPREERSNIAQKICLFLYNTDNKYIIR